MPATASYKLRKLKKPDTPKDQFDAASLAVPMDIAKMLPEDMRFTPELTDDGILYRPTRTITASSAEVPSWLNDRAKAEPKTTGAGKAASASTK